MDRWLAMLMLSKKILYGINYKECVILLTSFASKGSEQQKKPTFSLRPNRKEEEKENVLTKT